MLQASAAPFHSDLQPQRKAKLQKLIKNMLVISRLAPAIAKGLAARNRTGSSVCLDNISHQTQSATFVEAEQRFRMKLYGLNRQVTMANPHDDPILRLGRY